MNATIYVKFFHPKLNATWSSRERVFGRNLQEIEWILQGKINEFLNAGWVLKDKRIINPQEVKR